MHDADQVNRLGCDGRTLTLHLNRFRRAAAFNVTVTSLTELTATGASACAGANPAALTVTRYAPGSRSSTELASILAAGLALHRRIDCLHHDLRRGVFALRSCPCTRPRRDPRGALRVQRKVSRKSHGHHYEAISKQASLFLLRQMSETMRIMLEVVLPWLELLPG
jgi:hypothetical protein